jgi:hypothetical protein
MWYVSTTIKEVEAVTRTKYDSKQTIQKTNDGRWMDKENRH